MADVFISYKREDSNVAKALAEKLLASGWSVWWDRNIPIGKPFDQVIEEELAAAKCVVVLWTKLSVASLNVKEEAAEGLRRKILIPVQLGEITPPYGFRMIQTLRWSQSPQDEELNQAVNEVERLLSDLPKKPIPETLPDDDAGDQRIDDIPASNEFTETVAKPATLRFVRKYNWIGAALSFKIYIDGEKFGTLSINETFEARVKPGAHHIRVSGGGTFTDANAKISVKSGDVVLWEVGYTITGGARLSQA